MKILFLHGWNPAVGGVKPTYLNDHGHEVINPAGPREDMADEGKLALLEPHVRAFDITRKPMKKWVAVEPEGGEDDDHLKEWIERAAKFVRTLPRK